MKCLKYLSSLMLLYRGILEVDAFGTTQHHNHYLHLSFGTLNHRKNNLDVFRRKSVSSLPMSSSSVPSDVDDSTDNDDTIDGLLKDELDVLKSDLLQLCASYDRGYGASAKARDDVQVLVEELERRNPTPQNANRGIDLSREYNEDVPLRGIWRMVWTTALDVLNLGASPIAAPGAIYQDIRNPPLAINIIDFIPRIQSLLPLNFPPSLLRAEVATRASSRPQNSNNRVGLTFEAVKLKPVELLGQKNNDILPPLSINFPTIPLDSIPGVDPDNTPGYFDVTYLDDNMLIIKQNAPGGYFVLIKVPNCDP